MFMWCVVDADRRRGVRVVDHDVGVRARRDDRPSAGTGRTCGPAWWQHVSTQRASEMLAVDDALVDEVHAVLDAADAVRDLREVADARAPSGPSSRTGSGRWTPPRGRSCAGPSTGRPGGLVPVRSGGRAHATWRPRSRARRAFLERQVEVLRAGLGEHVAAVVAGGARPLERLARRHVHDVQRAVAGDAGQHDRPVGRLALQSRTGGSSRGTSGRSRRARAPAATSTSMAMPFSACIMTSAPLSAGRLHRPQDLPVVASRRRRGRP